MASHVELRIRLKITLATEQFQGPDHTGANSAAYMLKHPVTIFTHGDSDKLRWMQHRDLEGHFEDRLPPNGLVSLNQDECRLNDTNGRPVVILSSFTSPMISSSGVAEYRYKKSRYEQQKDSHINWVGRGLWELVADTSAAPEPRFLTSAWTFNTSSSAGVGGLVVEFGTGKLVFDDPSRVARSFAYIGGGGSVDLGKALKLIKALKNLVWMEKVAAATGAATKVSGGSSTEDNFSKGVILKNVLTVGTRELTKDDFLGPCIWIDGSIGIYKSLGGMLLLTNFSSVGPIPTFRACVPCGGVNYAPVAAGLGACIGNIIPG